jgi:hypothetical protein
MNGSRRRTLRAGGLVLVGALLGSLIGPPIASAVGSIVTIEGSGSTNKAKVSSAGALSVDTGASLQSPICGFSKSGPTHCKALAITLEGGNANLSVSAGGNTVIGSGTSGTTLNCGGVLEAVTVDNAGGSAATVSLSASRVISRVPWSGLLGEPARRGPEWSVSSRQFGHAIRKLARRSSLLTGGRTPRRSMPPWRR